MRWRERLLAKIEADPRSDRAISKAAGLGDNFINQMKARGTSPSLAATEKLCATLGTSAIEIITGLKLDPAGEEFIRLAAARSPEEREHLFQLLRMLDGSSVERR